jgi:hypothetical protein
MPSECAAERSSYASGQHLAGWLDHQCGAEWLNPSPKPWLPISANGEVLDETAIIC